MISKPSTIAATMLIAAMLPTRTVNAIKIGCPFLRPIDSEEKPGSTLQAVTAALMPKPSNTDKIVSPTDINLPVVTQPTKPEVDTPSMPTERKAVSEQRPIPVPQTPDTSRNPKIDIKIDNKGKGLKDLEQKQITS